VLADLKKPAPGLPDDVRPWAPELGNRDRQNGQGFVQTELRKRLSDIEAGVSVAPGTR